MSSFLSQRLRHSHPLRRHPSPLYRHPCPLYRHSGSLRRHPEPPSRHSGESWNPERPATRSWLPVALLAIILFTMALACSSQSPNIGKYYKGRILHISVAAMERTDELRWTTSTRYPAQGTIDDPLFRLEPESSENELILLRVKVENHTATSAIVNVDHESAQLRDFLQGRYFPIDVSARAQEAEVPENPSDRCNVPVNPDAPTDCVKFLWNATYEEIQSDGETKLIQRAQELPRGTGLDGWLVFEAPKDTQFRSFRWGAGDTVTIDF